jgi:uncharacterized protein
MPIKPSEKEEEYFLRQEFEAKKKKEEEKLAQLKEDERNHLKDLHYMHCPKCGHNLIEIKYHDISVDKCSNCDGVWLDAGELEQISRLENTSLSNWFNIFKK